jgi:hypothetical protein
LSASNFSRAASFLRETWLPILMLVLFLFAGGFGFYCWFKNGPRHDHSLDFVFQCGSATTEWSHPLFHYIFAHQPAQLSPAIVIGAFILLARMDRAAAREMAVLGSSRVHRARSPF